MDGLTRDIVTSGNNVFSLDNVDYNINYMYTYYDMNITNSDIYFNPDYSNGVNYWENSTIYRIDANVGTNSTFKNTTIDSSTYSRLFPTSTLNFEPGSDNNRIDKLYVINAGTRTITGYVSFTDLYTAWTAGNYINRYFPINLTNIIGEGVSDIDVLIKDSVGADVNSGTSGATGIANINVTDDENATYQIYIGGEWMVNFSMLGSTAPYGIQVDVIKPVIDYAKILPDPFYTDDGLVTWVNCSDGFYDPLGVYWKVYNNSVEFPSENGQENVSSGTNTNLYNISSSLTEKGENWTVEFTCSNWVVNSTAVNASVVIQNTVPETYTSVILNSSLGTNLTSENLSVSFSGASDLDSDSLTNITDWRIDGSSVAVLNMPFDSNRSGQSGAVVRDYSSYENNGTLAGTSTDPTWSSDCQVGGCYDFDDDYLSVSDEIELRLHNFTLSAWIKFNQLSTGSWFGIVGKGSRFASRNYAFFQAPSTNQIFYSFSNGTVFASHYSNKTDFSVDTWYYVVTTYNGSSFNLYVDGDLDSNYSESRTPITTSDDFFIGGISTYTGFNGSIDEVQVYNFALSKNQIKEIYDAGVAGHQVETFVSQETNGGDNWTVTVTPNDGEVDGTTVLSNWLEILAGDTCTYSGSGSWAVDCSDACNVTSTVDLSGNDISITGVGTFSTTANITNYGTLHLEGDSETEICHVICQGGCFVN